MNFIIQEEYKNFIEDINNTEFEIGQYIDISEYEDEHSHNEIEEAMEKLAFKIKTYLKKEFPNKFIVYTGWCVFVMTKERARKSKLSEKTIEDRLIK